MVNEKIVSVEVKLPEDTSWDEIKEIEDEISQSAGEVLESHGLERVRHERNVKADYSGGG